MERDQQLGGEQGPEEEADQGKNILHTFAAILGHSGGRKKRAGIRIFARGGGGTVHLRLMHFAHSRDCHGRPNLGAGPAREECPAAKAGKDLIADIKSRIIFVGSRMSSHTAEARTHPAISASTCRRKDRSSSSSSLDSDSDSHRPGSSARRQRTKGRLRSTAVWLSSSKFPEDKAVFF